ncbi:transposase, partial [Pseudomonas sp. GM21]
CGSWIGYPDDPALLKQMLLEAFSRQQVTAEAYQTHIVDLKEQIKLLRDRLFGRKCEQTVEPNTPQLALFNEPESEPMTLVGDVDEEVDAPTPRRGKRKPLSANLPRIEVIHELPEHELTCACGCRKHVVSEETSEQLDVVPMQIRVIKHIRKVYGCRGCERAPVTADKPAQLIEKSMAHHPAASAHVHLTGPSLDQGQQQAYFYRLGRVSRRHLNNDRA